MGLYLRCNNSKKFIVFPLNLTGFLEITKIGKMFKKELISVKVPMNLPELQELHSNKPKS